MTYSCTEQFDDGGAKPLLVICGIYVNDPLAYRLVEYIVLILGVAAKKLEYATLVSKATTLIKHMNQPFCERQGEGLCSVFSQVMMLQELS